MTLAVCPDFQKLEEFARGLLSPQEQIRWAEHVEHCSECASRIELLRSVDTDKGGAHETAISSRASAINEYLDNSSHDDLINEDLRRVFEAARRGAPASLRQSNSSCLPQMIHSLRQRWRS